jgi:hypothetical protein
MANFDFQFDYDKPLRDRLLDLAPQVTAKLKDEGIIARKIIARTSAYPAYSLTGRIEGTAEFTEYSLKFRITKYPWMATEKMIKDKVIAGIKEVAAHSKAGG